MSLNEQRDRDFSVRATIVLCILAATTGMLMATRGHPYSPLLHSLIRASAIAAALTATGYFLWSWWQYLLAMYYDD